MLRLMVMVCLLLSPPAIAQLLAAEPTAKAKLTELPSEQSDAATEQFLKGIFSKTPAMSEVSVKVSSGVIYLSGNLSNQKDSEWMLDIAERLPNVLAVSNKTSLQGVSFGGLEPMWRELNELTKRLEKHLPSILFALIFFALVFFLSSSLTRAVRKALARKIANPFLLSVVTRVTLLPIWVLLFYFGLRLLGLSTLGATLIGGTSVLGIVLGLAFKGIAENFLAGLLLASRSPFTRGDIIRIGEYKGYVENLNMRGTTIIDLNGNLILIPNLMVIQSVVENQTANPKTRTSFKVGISYQDSISRAQDAILNAISSVQGVLADPAPNVVVNELAGNSVELTVHIWFDSTISREVRVRSRAIINAKEALLANGFTIPGDSRELVFTNPLKVTNVDASIGSAPDENLRKAHIQTRAEQNLAEPESRRATEGPSSADMLKQAELNPLPTSTTESSLLGEARERK